MHTSKDVFKVPKPLFVKERVHRYNKKSVETIIQS